MVYTPTKDEKIQFQKMIETLVKEKNLNEIEALIYYCQQHNIVEMETLSKLVNPTLKEKISILAASLNLLNKVKLRKKKKKDIKKKKKK